MTYISLFPGSSHLFSPITTYKVYILLHLFFDLKVTQKNILLPVYEMTSRFSSSLRLGRSGRRRLLQFNQTPKYRSMFNQQTRFIHVQLTNALATGAYLHHNDTVKPVRCGPCGPES